MSALAAASTGIARRNMATPREIVIVGGGIMGCTTAYFLSRHPSYSPESHHITLLEAAKTSTGGRTKDSIPDPAILADPATVSKKNPAHDGIAGGASGKAAGLLALWAFPDNIAPLSFKLHEDLASEHGGDKRWGYRRCWASQVELNARLPPDPDGDAASGRASTTSKSASTASSRAMHKDHKKKKPELGSTGAPADLDWIDKESLVAYEGIGTPDNTAQIHPELFTRSIAQLAEDAGVRIVTGARVTAINRSSDGSQVESVTYERGGEEITHATTDCVVAAGPWTSRLLPEIDVFEKRTHSVVFKTPRPFSAHTLFATLKLPAGFRTPVPPGALLGTMEATPSRRQRMGEPEIYARPDGTVYVCGPSGDAVKLPLCTDEVEADEARCEDVIAQTHGISDELRREGKVLTRQACYVPHGGPFIGQVGSTKGLIVAAGHGVWGIQNGPGTGKLVSEIIMDGKATSAKLGDCDPSNAS
ncbi:FAD dependent oxidoreductase [Xylaria intraflava]|nr:FAD dependent oxidoreductase [Xylaria intraflava]